MYRSSHSLTSALDGPKWSASRPCRFTPRERAPGTHWIEGCVSPRAVLDAVVNRKIPNATDYLLHYDRQEGGGDQSNTSTEKTVVRFPIQERQ
jgi:hypothetical protein